MKIKFSLGFIGILVIGLIIGMGTIAPGMADDGEEKISADPNKVHGFIDAIGKDFILVKGQRYFFSPTAVFYDEEGGKVVEGKKRLRSNMRVDLSLEKDKVAEVIIYGLLMR